ncbi:hypothetical protein C8J56DRAFT_727312, partial [Mycena floridula]
YISRLFIMFGTADGPGMIYLNGLVGHCGKVGCRLWYGMVWRRERNGERYYPMMGKPSGDYRVEGCSH